MKKINIEKEVESWGKPARDKIAEIDHVPRTNIICNYCNLEIINSKKNQKYHDTCYDIHRRAYQCDYKRKIRGDLK